MPTSATVVIKAKTQLRARRSPRLRMLVTTITVGMPTNKPTLDWLNPMPIMINAAKTK